MALNDDTQATVNTSLDAAATGFAALLSDDEFEDPKSSETQPTQQSPASESDDEDEASEASESEDATAETDEESEAADDEAPAPVALDPNTKVVVVVDGQEVEVTLDEMRKGYSRQADYTRKTQELATQRKTQEAEFNAVRGERAKYAELMGQLEQALRDATGQEPDWAKIQAERPEEFPLLWAQWQQRTREIEAVAAERERAEQAVQRDRSAAQQTYLKEQQDLLLAALPEWKDGEKAKAEKAAIVAYAEKSGFSREELAQVVDHRAILMLRKAMLYDKAQAAKPALVKKVEKVKAATPGPTQPAKKPVSQLTSARQRLAKTGRVEDAAEGFALMLGDDL
jgi:hypothetical protein